MGKLINSNKGSIRSFPNGGSARTPYGAKDPMGGDSGWYPEQWGWGPTGSRATGGPVSKPKSISSPRSMYEGGIVENDFSFTGQSPNLNANTKLADGFLKNGRSHGQLVQSGDPVKPNRVQVAKSAPKVRSMNMGGIVKPVLKPVSRPVRKSMANGGAAKAKPASRSGCCRGNGGRAAPRPASRPAPLRGGSRSRTVK